MNEETINSRLAKLEMCLYGIEQSNLNPHAQNQSFEVAELATAFSKAQGEYVSVGKNRSNPYFKSRYADLDAILKSARPILSKYGLSFYQYTSLVNGETILHSRILHASGQWVESQTKIAPPKNDIQSYGSTMSYQRRYSALTLLGYTTTEDICDDDGNSVTPTNPSNVLPSAPTLRRAPSTGISKTQIDELNKAIGTKIFLKAVIRKKLNIDSLADMSNSDFPTVMNIVRKTGSPNE